MCLQAPQNFNGKPEKTGIGTQAKTQARPSFFTLNNPSKQVAASSALDTLAQLTPNPEKDLQKKARRKAITAFISSQLIKLDTENKQAYRNMFYCNSVLMQENQELTTSYCKNRFCLVCNAIKTANLINGYIPVLKEFEEPYFLTLTIPAVQEDKLKQSIDLMQKTFRKIMQNLTKYQKVKIKAIRKLECNYNPQKKTYNPHFHFIIDNYQNGKILQYAWLKSFPGVKSIAQDLRKADEASLVELFKYATKIIVKGKIHAESLDKIYSAMRNRRIVQPVGLKKIEIDEDAREKTTYPNLSNDVAQWDYEAAAFDWVNRETGEILTNWQPDEQLQKILTGKSISKEDYIELRL